MQPNTLAAPRQLMHDVTPPYASSFAQRIQPVQPAAVAPEPQQPPAPTTEPQPAMFPVHSGAPDEVHNNPEPLPPTQNPPMQQSIKPQEQSTQPVVIKAKTNWMIIIAAVLVACGLGVAAYYAYKGQLGGGKLFP